MPPELARIAYRLVQEALTNAIKHAGAAPTQVTVSIGTRDLELAVSDTGLGPSPGREDRDGSGHGLVGMRERVTLYGGELRARPGSEGGFEVRARIPLVETTPLPRAAPMAEFDPVVVPATSDRRWPWLDPVLAGVVLVALEIEASTSSYRRGPLVLNMIATGRTNAEIASELIVGETTVKTHVTRILMKLGVRDRVQAVVLAYETGVVIPSSGPRRLRTT
ncbi:MAG: LuxR C-terminal-related transcriptional regulator [Actinomycetota bacterium]|nr:LuxR C-terminal-related transcriptional regulator [Actinomycetota bacterium]